MADGYITAVQDDDTRFTVVSCEGLRIVARKAGADYDGSVDFDGMSLQVWEGGRLLARRVKDGTIAVRGRSVLEIGCGCGAASVMCATAAGGAASVVATDYNPVALVVTRKNLQLNGGGGDGPDLEARVKACILDWDAPPSPSATVETFDVVLAADVLFVTAAARKFHTLFAPLLAAGGTLHLFHEVRRSVVLATGERDVADEPFDAFLALLEESGFASTVTPCADSTADVVHVVATRRA